MKAVSFMYVRPPGYNAESAKAAEIVDERKMQDQNNPNADGASTSMYCLQLLFCLSIILCFLRGEKKITKLSDISFALFLLEKYVTW